jgi:hypothetical protein
MPAAGLEPTPLGIGAWIFRPRGQTFEWLRRLAAAKLSKAQPNKPPTDTHLPDHCKYMWKLQRWPNADTKLASCSEKKLTCDTCNSTAANQKRQQVRAFDNTCELHARKFETRDRTRDLQIFGPTPSQLSYRG